MKGNLIFFGWNRPVRGKERVSAEHFQQITAWFGELQAKGTLQSWEAVFVQPHGGDLNGFFLLRGEPDKLDALQGTPEWTDHTVRASLHLEDFGALRGYTGGAVMEMMGIWSKHI